MPPSMINHLTAVFCSFYHSINHALWRLEEREWFVLWWKPHRTAVRWLISGHFGASPLAISLCTDKKGNTIFLIYGNSDGCGCKFIMRKGFLIDEERSKYLVINEEAVKSYMTLQQLPFGFPYIRGKFCFLFISVCSWWLNWRRSWIKE
jgi:hypothetical protein